MIRNLGIVSIFWFIHIIGYAQSSQGVLLGHWFDNELQGSSLYGNIYNEVWGLAVNGSEFAIIGSTEGTHFINVTDPSKPSEDFFVRGASYGGHIIHRDYHDHNGYLYAVSDEDTDALKSTLQIIDIRNLPERIDVVYDSNQKFRKSHNIFIDEAQSRLYACNVRGGDSPFSGLRVYDISELEPEFLLELKGNIGGESFATIHDLYVRDNLAFLNAGNDGLLIVDFSDISNPQLLSSIRGTDYPESGYNHSGWLSDDGNYYYFADETWGTAMKVYDVSDPVNISLVTTLDAGNDSDFSIAHNQVIVCDYLFSSYYYDGLQVHDISNPEEPVRVMFFPTTNLPARFNYEGAWGVYPLLPSGNILVSDMQNGLFIVEKYTNYCLSSSANEITLEKIDLRVFPNPNLGIFTIKSNNEIQKLRIYNITGALVYESSNFNENTFNMEFLKEGVYFAEVYIDELKLIEKIIIQH